MNCVQELSIGGCGNSQEKEASVSPLKGLIMRMRPLSRGKVSGC